MANKTVNIGGNLTKYQFSDSEGNVIAYFHKNPLDIRIAERAAASADKLQKISAEALANPSVEDLARYDKEIAEAINHILGYDASATLFTIMSASTPMDDGEVFASVVLRTISDNLETDIKNRLTKFQAAAKHTAKYQ